MTEEENIFNSKIFNASTPELIKIKYVAHIACQKHNSLNENEPLRLALLKSILGNIGSPIRFHGPVQFNYGAHTFISNNFLPTSIYWLWMMPASILATM